MRHFDGVILVNTVKPFCMRVNLMRKIRELMPKKIFVLKIMYNVLNRCPNSCLANPFTKSLHESANFQTLLKRVSSYFIIVFWLKSQNSLLYSFCYKSFLARFGIRCRCTRSNSTWFRKRLIINKFERYMHAA